MLGAGGGKAVCVVGPHGAKYGRHSDWLSTGVKTSVDESDDKLGDFSREVLGGRFGNGESFESGLTTVVTSGM